MKDEKPDCFDSYKQFLDWSGLREGCTYDANDKHPYCRDCTSKYMEEMIKEGRCELVDPFSFHRLLADIVMRVKRLKFVIKKRNR